MEKLLLDFMDPSAPLPQLSSIDSQPEGGSQAGKGSYGLGALCLVDCWVSWASYIVFEAHMISSWLGTGVVATTLPSRLAFSKAEDLRVSH